MRKVIMAAVMIVLGAGTANCETYTMESYYPSPVGVYTDMTVTSNAVLARDGGKVGIGTASPGAKLEVNGTVNVAGDANFNGVVVPGRLAADPAAPGQKIEGAIYFNTTLKKHRVFQNASWNDLGGGGSMITGNGAAMVLPAGGPYKVMVWGTYFSCGDYTTSLRLDGTIVKTYTGANTDSQGCDQNTIMTIVTNVLPGTHTWSFFRSFGMSHTSQQEFRWMPL